MATKSRTNISIIEAVETLSSIADLELDKEMGIAQKHEITLHNEPVEYKTVHWLHEQDASSTVNLVKETFRVILNYLRQFYRKEYGYVTDPKTIEGIKTIMVLVGEAAKKLDRYTALFHQTHQKSVTELREYKLLQDFYLSKIARKIDEGVLGKWILGLSLAKMKIQPGGPLPKLAGVPSLEMELARMEDETKHVFVDLESVKKDSEYELFFIRKEDGTRFFSPRLLRNIKLVCDFGDYFGEPKVEDSLLNISRWLDRVYNQSAKNILKVLGGKVAHFFHDIRKAKDQEVVEEMNKALMALMLSSHTENLSRNNPIKTCTEYFVDFQVFLRSALNTRTYQKWIAYPPNETSVLALDLLDIMHTVCRALYSSMKGMNEMISIIHILIQDAQQGISQEHQKEAHLSKKIWNQLAANYSGMTKFLKRHPYGPLLKVLTILEGDAFNTFDPLIQQNIPTQLYGLYGKEERRIENLRFATPVHQEFINKAVINEEFKGFLRDYKKEKKTHLLINLQDRTSWVEHARCAALEELQHNPDLQEAISVATLAIDTDFYHQLAPYHQINHANSFIKQFKEHLKGEGSGFNFPDSIDKGKLYEFIDKAAEAIHRIFFSSKNVLLREHRLDFIEIFYLFLQLKLIDMIQPDSFSLTCKDGIDIGMPYNVELFILLKLLNSPEWSENDIDYLNLMLYAPPLLIRERILLPERFNRMLSAIKAIESAQVEFGKDHFSKVVQEGFFALYDTSILSSKLLLPT